LKCPKCGSEQAEESIECLRCGIIFDRYRAFLESRGKNETPRRIAPDEGEEEAGRLLGTVREILLHVEPQVNLFHLAGRALVYVLMLLWGWAFILSPMESNIMGQSFLHTVNLVFHEAGHVIFSFFGDFIGGVGRISRSDPHAPHLFWSSSHWDTGSLRSLGSPLVDRRKPDGLGTLYQ